MKKYIFVFLSITLATACNLFKKTTERPAVTASETVVEEVIEESTVPDLVTPDQGQMGDCSEDWSQRERLVLKKNEDRISKLMDATSGQIFVITSVTKSGFVSKVSIDKLNTTVKKEIWLNMALEIVSEYEFEPIDDGPKYECGTVKFYLTTM